MTIMTFVPILHHGFTCQATFSILIFIFTNCIMQSWRKWTSVWIEQSSSGLFICLYLHKRDWELLKSFLQSPSLFYPHLSVDSVFVEGWYWSRWTMVSPFLSKTTILIFEALHYYISDRDNDGVSSCILSTAGRQLGFNIIKFNSLLKASNPVLWLLPGTPELRR